MEVIRAFVRLQCQIELSYIFNLILNFLGGIFFLSIFFFISESVVFSNQELLIKYGNDYFLFSALGIILIDMTLISTLGTSNSFREGQTMGYLDNLISCRINIFLLFFALVSYPLIKSLFRGVMYLVLIIIFITDSLAWLNLIDFLIILALSLIPFLGIGMISVSFTMLYKIGNPINILVTVITSLFSGVFYPVESLPAWAETLSKFIPLTYSLECLRLRILGGEDYSELLNEILILIIFSIFLLLVGSLAMYSAYYKSRKNGTISDY